MNSDPGVNLDWLGRKTCIHLFNEAALISNIVADFIIKPKPWQARVQASCVPSLEQTQIPVMTVSVV